MKYEGLILWVALGGDVIGRAFSFLICTANLRSSTSPSSCASSVSSSRRRIRTFLSSSSIDQPEEPKSSLLSSPDLTGLESIVLPSGDDAHGDDAWKIQLKYQPYVSDRFDSLQEWKDFLLDVMLDPEADPLWEQIKLEATMALGPEPEAGPQVYQGILSHSSLLEAVVTVIAHEIETELIQATELKELFMECLLGRSEEEGKAMAEVIRSDVRATAIRSGSVGDALTAVLFHIGLHALVCYRVGHILWQEDRKGLAYYLQSTVSRKYSADIHPAAQLGNAQYLSSTAGVVIGETAVTGDDVSILPG